MPTSSAAGEPAVEPRGRGRASAVIPADLGVEAVSKSYGGRTVLADLSLAVKAAEVVCLLGPSGCGKTTLLRLVAGMETLDAGRILMDGRPISTPTHALPPDKRGIGLVFQDYALFPHMTVVENVSFGLRACRGRSRRRRRAWPSPASASPISPRPIPICCRAASSSAWPSPVRSCRGRASC